MSNTTTPILLPRKRRYHSLTQILEIHSQTKHPQESSDSFFLKLPCRLVDTQKNGNISMISGVEGIFRGKEEKFIENLEFLPKWHTADFTSHSPQPLSSYGWNFNLLAELCIRSRHSASRQATVRFYQHACPMITSITSPPLSCTFTPGSPTYSANPHFFVSPIAWNLVRSPYKLK